MKNLTQNEGTIPLPPKSCQGEEPGRCEYFQTVVIVLTGSTFIDHFCRTTNAPGLCTTNEGYNSFCDSLTRAQPIDSLASHNMKASFTN